MRPQCAIPLKVLHVRLATTAPRARILGHQDVKLTLRYAHLSPEHLRAEVEKTDGRNALAWAQGGRKDPSRSEECAVTA